jgi:hypothetical protein
MPSRDPMTPRVCVESAVQGAAECEMSAAGALVGPPGVTGTSRAHVPAGFSGASTTRYVPYDRLTTGPDGEACMTTGYHEEGAVPADGVVANPANQQPFIYANLAASYPPCPEAPRRPGEAAPVETRTMVAARYWERIPLPAPRPVIAPGRAITGMTAYLETNGQVAHTYTNETVFGPLVIEATGSYTVDWGDGETSGPHGYEGGPWPQGRITHDYLHVGAYDIVVTERWTATWSLGGERGVLRTLQTTGRIDGFPVQQIQAVIAR